MSQHNIFCNVELFSVATFIRDRWNGVPGATFRLFRNDLEPDPSSEKLDFVECSFNGYVPQLLSADLSALVKIQDGWYQSVSSTFVYYPPLTGVGNIVYGSYVLFDGEVVACSRFPTPIPIEVGGVAVSVQLKLNVKSESLLD